MPSDAAPQSWCLPASGGRVVVRGYDDARDEVTSIAGTERWRLNESFIPTSSSAGEQANGPAGEVHPGDCVIFIGPGDSGGRALAWFPRRVIAIDAPNDGWQRVWTLWDDDVQDHGMFEHDHYQSVVAEVRAGSDPLLGRARVRVLDAAGLAVDCPRCGAVGRPIMWGLPVGDPGVHVALGGCIVTEDQDMYTCERCSEAWRVTDDGAVIARSADDTYSDHGFWSSR